MRLHLPLQKTPIFMPMPSTSIPNGTIFMNVTKTVIYMYHMCQPKKTLPISSRRLSPLLPSYTFTHILGSATCLSILHSRRSIGVYILTPNIVVWSCALTCYILLHTVSSPSVMHTHGLRWASLYTYIVYLPNCTYWFSHRYSQYISCVYTLTEFSHRF